MLTFLIVLSATFILGGLVGLATASLLAAARQAELLDLWDKASRDAGRAERELARLRARCRRECDFKWLDRPSSVRRGEV
jgi:hypothetical protein